MGSFDLIQQTVVGSGGTANITFSSIPNTYTDLKIVLSIRTNYTLSARDDVKITLNNDTGSNYSSRRLIGYDSGQRLADGASGTPSQNLTLFTTTNLTTVSTFGMMEIYIPNYTASTTKSYLIDPSGPNNSSTSWILGITSHNYNQTTAISNVKIEPAYGTAFVEHSSASLYGITAGSSGGVTVS